MDGSSVILRCSKADDRIKVFGWGPGNRNLGAQLRISRFSN